MSQTPKLPQQVRLPVEQYHRHNQVGFKVPEFLPELVLATLKQVQPIRQI
jgi:hypothetical protein